MERTCEHCSTTFFAFRVRDEYTLIRYTGRSLLLPLLFCTRCKSLFDAVCRPLSDLTVPIHAALSEMAQELHQQCQHKFKPEIAFRLSSPSRFNSPTENEGLHTFRLGVCSIRKGTDARTIYGAESIQAISAALANRNPYPTQALGVPMYPCGFVPMRSLPYGKYPAPKPAAPPQPDNTKKNIYRIVSACPVGSLSPDFMKVFEVVNKDPMGRLLERGFDGSWKKLNPQERKKVIAEADEVYTLSGKQEDRGDNAPGTPGEGNRLAGTDKAKSDESTTQISAEIVPKQQKTILERVTFGPQDTNKFLSFPSPDNSPELTESFMRQLPGYLAPTRQKLFSQSESVEGSRNVWGDVARDGSPVVAYKIPWKYRVLEQVHREAHPGLSLQDNKVSPTQEEKDPAPSVQDDKAEDSEDSSFQVVDADDLDDDDFVHF